MGKKIAIIGAGSVGFTRNMVRDILSVPELSNSDIALMDIDQRNLDMIERLLRKDIEANGVDATIQATINQREAVRDADFVFCFVRVGGLEAFEQDVEIPLTYGVDQCVGDTLGPGGVFYAQRGIPVLLNLCRDIREVAKPDCLLLNYSNPMAMLTWACAKYGGVKVVGLCHGVIHGHAMIADCFGLPKSEVDVICAGINHQTWFVQIRHNGRDLTGELLAAMERHPTYSVTEKVRIDMLRRFGYFSTESNGHLSEYVPWYRKRAQEIPEWIDMSFWIHGETGGYLRACRESRHWFETEFPEWMEGEPYRYGADQRGNEHGSYILEGLVTGRTYRGHFNVVNHGCIENLPPDCVIEAPGYVDGNGISMPRVGPLPLGCAAVCNASVSVQRLAVEAAVTGDDTLLRQAVLVDPLTAAVCRPDEVWQMVDDMLIALAPWLPQYGPAIDKARVRRENGPPPPRSGYRGAARKEPIVS